MRAIIRYTDPAGRSLDLIRVIRRTIHNKMPEDYDGPAVPDITQTVRFTREQVIDDDGSKHFTDWHSDEPYWPEYDPSDEVPGYKPDTNIIVSKDVTPDTQPETFTVDYTLENPAEANDGSNSRTNDNAGSQDSTNSSEETADGDKAEDDEEHNGSAERPENSTGRSENSDTKANASAESSKTSEKNNDSATSGATADYGDDIGARIAAEAAKKSNVLSGSSENTTSSSSTGLNVRAGSQQTESNTGEQDGQENDEASRQATSGARRVVSGHPVAIKHSTRQNKHSEASSHISKHLDESMEPKHTYQPAVLLKRRSDEDSDNAETTSSSMSGSTNSIDSAPTAGNEDNANLKDPRLYDEGQDVTDEYAITKVNGEEMALRKAPDEAAPGNEQPVSEPEHFVKPYHVPRHPQLIPLSPKLSYLRQDKMTAAMLRQLEIIGYFYFEDDQWKSVEFDDNMLLEATLDSTF